MGANRYNTEPYEFYCFYFENMSIEFLHKYLFAVFMGCKKMKFFRLIIYGGINYEIF